MEHIATTEIPRLSPQDLIDYDILGSPEFHSVFEAYRDYPENSLLNPYDRALLYFLVKALGAVRVLEIGTYLGGTTEVLARALGGRGSLVSADPGSGDKAIG